MANKHVKVINGRKYYYESIRKGKKVTSRYLGPVEPLRKKKAEIDKAVEIEEKEEILPTDEESYIG